MKPPLSGRTILLTRDGGLADRLRSLGAAVRVAEVVRYQDVPVEDPGGPYDWVVFTSARAVRRFPGPLPAGARVACVGPSTAEAVRARRTDVSFVPERHDAGALARELSTRADVRGARVLLPCSERSSTTIEDALESAGASVTRLVLYRPAPAKQLDPGVEGDVDVIVFLAPSAVEAFVRLGGNLHAAPVLAIGETTAEEVRRHGVPAAVAPSSDAQGLIEALTAWEF